MLDTGGQFAAVTGKGEKLTLASWYLPPGLQMEVLRKLGDWLAKTPESMLIIGSDFNLTMRGEEDRIVKGNSGMSGDR